MTLIKAKKSLSRALLSEKRKKEASYSDVLKAKKRVNMYQYISDDEHSYTLKGKDGKEFKVAKQSISDAIHGKITNMKPKKMADGGIVPDALNPDYQQIDQSSYMPDLSAPVQMPAQPVQQYQSPDPGVISNDQWNQLSPVDRQSYLDPLHAKADQSPLGKIGSYIGDLAGRGRQEKQQQLEQAGLCKPIEVPQVETPEMTLQKQLQAQSQLPQAEQQQSNYNLPQSQILGLMQGRALR